MLDVQEAMKPDAPRLHEEFPNNILAHTTIRNGNYEEASREPGLIKVEGWYDTPTVQHCHIENHKMCIRDRPHRALSYHTWAVSSFSNRPAFSNAAKRTCGVMGATSMPMPVAFRMALRMACSKRRKPPMYDMKALYEAHSVEEEMCIRDRIIAKRFEAIALKR